MAETAVGSRFERARRRWIYGILLAHEMMQTQLDVETRTGLMHEIARYMGLDGQDAHRTKEEKVNGIDLRYVDDDNRETQISEFRGDEINGPNSGLDSIVRMIESATLRDAYTRYGNVVYAIYFHMSGGQMNRGRYPFVVPGGGHMSRNGPGGANGMVRHGGGYGGPGGPMMDSQAAADSLRVSVEFLKWSTTERQANDERTNVLFRTMESVIKSQADMLDSGLKRELRVRELEADMLDHKYELDKKRKADEEREQWVGKAIQAAETYGPMLLPPVVEAIRKFNHGPGYVPHEMSMEAIQEQIRKAKEAAGVEGGGGHPPQNGTTNHTNGGGNGHGGNGHGGGSGQAGGGGAGGGGAGGEQPSADGTAAAQQQPAQSSNEPTPIELFHHRIAFDLVRFVALVKGNDRLVKMREALEGSAPAQSLLDAIVTAAGKPGIGSDEKSIEELTQLAMMFGGALMQTPQVGLALAQTLEGFERAALLELSDLLKRYVEFTEQVAAAQRAQQGGQGQTGANAP